MVPKRVFFTKGVGKNKHELQSFELALRNAGIEKCNIVNVSSIVPPKCKIITKEKVKNVKESVKKNPYASFQDWVQRHEDGTSMWTHANIDEPSKVTENTRTCNTIRCLWADTWREWGAEDIGYLICCGPDFATIPAQHPNLRLERTKTCMQGDNCCDFKFIWEEKE